MNRAPPRRWPAGREGALAPGQAAACPAPIGSPQAQASQERTVLADAMDVPLIHQWRIMDSKSAGVNPRSARIGRLAAVDTQYLAGDEAAAAAEQERHGIGDLVRLGIACQRLARRIHLDRIDGA